MNIRAHSTIGLVVAFFFLVNTANAQQVNYILSLMDENRVDLKSLKCDITKSELDSALQDESVRSGQLQILTFRNKNPYVRIDWESPDETVVVASGRYLLYRKKINQAILGSARNAAKQKFGTNALSFLTMTKEELKDKFRFKYQGRPRVAGTRTWHLKLIPKQAARFSEAELWVNPQGMTIQALIRQKNSDETTVRLSGIKRDVKISASEFDMNRLLPDDVEIARG